MTATDNAVAEYLASIGVPYKAVYIGEEMRDWGGDKPQQVDAYRVYFGVFATDYHMGLGTRKLVKGAPKNTARHNTVAYTDYMRGYMRPCAPTSACVLYALLSDAQACDMSFNDWCTDFGYDADSITALNTYQACCSIGESMRKVFTSEQRAHLATLLEEY
jgi:hypothetical protein